MHHGPIYCNVRSLGSCSFRLKLSSLPSSRSLTTSPYTLIISYINFDNFMFNFEDIPRQHWSSKDMTLSFRLYLLHQLNELVSMSPAMTYASLGSSKYYLTMRASSYPILLISAFTLDCCSWACTFRNTFGWPKSLCQNSNKILTLCQKNWLMEGLVFSQIEQL
jgi:hypothetical protein